MAELKLIAGLDIGNGYAKGRVMVPGSAPTDIDMPSAVRVLVTSHNVPVEPDLIGEVVSNIHNEMDAVFSSPQVEGSARHLFGRRGVEYGSGNLREFRVDASHDTKARNELTFMLIFGCVAGKAVQAYYEMNHRLPPASETIDAHVDLATALPIQEFQMYRNELRHKLMDSQHMVFLHNFEEVISVRITFDAVDVIAEGGAAQQAIQQGGVVLMNSLLGDLMKMDKVMPGIADRLKNVTAEGMLAAKRSIGVDIGEGTVNFPVMNGNRLSNDLSSTMNTGYGVVLNDALAALRRRKMGIHTRKALTEYLNDGPSLADREIYDAIQGVVNLYVDSFADDIVKEFAGIISATGSTTNVIYVYGGGATPLRPVLYEKLLRCCEESLGGVRMAPPILYLDSRYSRNLNRGGLFIQATRLSQAAAQ